MPPHYRDRLRFLAQWLRNPRQTAAIAPSGADLAAAILFELPEGTRRVIELGGGTGAITRALLASGIPDSELLVLELNAALHAQLAHDFPRSSIVLGDAAELPQGEPLVVRLTVDTHGRRLDQLVIEDLLPAGWEIENPNLATSQSFGWLRAKAEGDRHRDARDDRMLIFTGPIQGEATFHYAVRATTPGVYALPPPTVADMYEPEIRGVGVGGQVRVRP